MGIKPLLSRAVCSTNQINPLIKFIRHLPDKAGHRNIRQVYPFQTTTPIKLYKLSLFSSVYLEKVFANPLTANSPKTDYGGAL